MPRRIEISHKTIVFTVFFLISLWFLFFIKEIILQFFVALLIMTTLDPLVSFLSKYRIPRAISVLISYLLVFGVFGLIIAAVVPPLVEQTASFATGLPDYLKNLGVAPFISERVVSELLAILGDLPAKIVRVGISIFSNFLSVLTVLTFAFYLLMIRDKLQDHSGFFFGEEKKREIGRMIDLLEVRLGGWARGQIFLMLVIGSVTYIGLLVLGIPFSLPLALLAGMLEIVPYIGPIIAAIPAAIIGFGISPLMGIAVTALVFLIQQAENYVIVPKIMEKSVGISPIIILLALAVGFRLLGVIGIFLSIPVVITLQVLFKEYFFK